MQKAATDQDSIHQENGQSDRSVVNLAFQNPNNLNQLKQLKKYMSLRIFMIMLILVIVIAYLLYSNLIVEKREKGQLTKQIQDLKLQNMNSIQQLQKRLDQTKKDMQMEAALAALAALKSRDVNKETESNIQMEAALRSRDVNIQVKDKNLHKPLGSHSPHQQLRFPYDTMGMQRYQKFNNTIVKKQEYYQFQSQFFDFLKPYVDTDCQFKRFGENFDGGYPVCVNYLNHSAALLNFGINGANFDMFGCNVTSYNKMPNIQHDCTNPGRPICPTNNNNNIFNFACVGSATQKSDYQYYSLKEIVDRNNLKGKNYIMKIDIQGGQWQALKAFPIQYLKFIDQIMIEIHLPGTYLEWLTLRWGYVNIMKNLQKYFYPVFWQQVYWGCHSKRDMQNKVRKIPTNLNEVVLVNKNLIKLKSNKRSYKTKEELRSSPRQDRCDLKD